MFKHGFERYLDNEISAEKYKKNLLRETIPRSVFLGVLHFIASFSVLYYPNTNSKEPTWQEILVISMLYCAIISFIILVSYGKVSTQASFLIDVKEKEKNTPQTSEFSKTFSRFVTPRKMGKLYLQSKVSKLNYIRSVFKYNLNLYRGIFIFFFIMAGILIFGLERDLLFKISVTFWIALLVTAVFKLRLSGFIFYAMDLTLQQKITQHQAFHQAENVHKTSET